MSYPDSNGVPAATRVHEQLRQKLEERTAQIGVIGLGYVGLPLAVAFAEEGFQTIGYDLSKERVEKVNRRENYIDDVKDDTLDRVVSEDRLRANADFMSAADVDVFYICVPTPVTDNKDPDTSYIESATRSIAEHLREGQLVILKSTTHPNTTEGIMQPLLEQAAWSRGLELGEDYFLAYSPERIDPGNETYTTENTPVVVGGVTQTCTELASLAMKQIVEHVHEVSRPAVAEMEKLLENIFRSVNIALVNEMARLCDRMGDVSIWEVVEAAATKPFGFMPFYPGPGLGGHCIPVDPYYLSWLAREYDFETNFITLSARTNEEMPYYVSDALIRAIADQPVSLSNARVLLLGVAFKGNVNDTRHSPAITIAQLLHDKGIGHIEYSDPHVPEWSLSINGSIRTLQSVDLSEEILGKYDAGIIVTDHDRFDYELIADQLPAIVDCRNALCDVDHDDEKVYLLGGGDF
jgi:UDP-N-acetyl-D-glucosamine dehydrogenase